ncbi:MAG: hypothetical protein HN846_03185 [Candidatus Pacebacteria bacterium]|jgi:hypothetical protein|nr:hypothetical protein [Candidatus Paceibacterota bacterium]MBT4005084.1 hypothetical protein [Candidatus Paceibacterota bacterium]MBT6898765.1 hypothetical protein [Candidatus Paceibacterota bacterium]MBT7309685.1 hypothetical protein [Candidatus Paceibacterota bacterium]MBT7499480.1 hypothetical protein [Candidatus Paceibacterota bacterium]
MKRSVLINLLVTFFVTISAATTQAQTITPDLDLTIFPPTAYLSIKPGTSLTHRMILKYEGAVRVKILPELVDFTTDGLTGTPVLQKPSQIEYIKLQNTDKQLGTPFILDPGSQVELVLAISPPLHAKQGEQPLSLVLTAVPDTTVVFDGGSAQASGAIASNVILSVQNDFDNRGELQIKEIQLPKFVDSFSSIKFEVLAKNIGRNGAAANGQIRLDHSWSGKELKHWYIYPDVVLASSTRQLRALTQDPDELDPAAEIIFEKLNYKPPFLIGPYEITVDLSSANQNNDSLHQRTQRIIAFPFSIIGLLLLGVVLYIIITKKNTALK